MNTLESIVAETLNIDPKLVTDALERDKIAEWDSFNHLVLIAEIEKRLKVTFTSHDVSSIKTYKELKEKVLSKR